ncbi:MAG: hypothetical protein V2A74_10795, partial [bacterium]
EAITRAEVDIQIATAHRFPRNMKTFLTRAIDLVTLDEEIAESCVYNRPVGKDKNGLNTYATGKSVRMAEIVASCFGNLRAGSMLIEATEKRVVARGFAHDLESNWAANCDVVESTLKADGRPMQERMRIVIAKAALSKALRDAIFRVVPGATCKPIETAARAIIAGDGSQATISRRRDRAMKWVKLLGIDPLRVFTAIGVTSEAELGSAQLERLTGLKTAIADSEITVDEAFPPVMVADGQKRRSDFSLSRKPEPMPPPEEPDEPDLPSPFDPASEPEEPPEPPKRGRPAGSTNKPKPAPEPVTLQNAEPESESPSVDAQLRDQQWFSSVVAKIKAVASNDELTAVVKAEIPPERLMDFSPYIKPLRSRFAQAERPAEPSGREDLF